MFGRIEPEIVDVRKPAPGTAQRAGHKPVHAPLRALHGRFEAIGMAIPEMKQLGIVQPRHVLHERIPLERDPASYGNRPQHPD